MKINIIKYGGSIVNSVNGYNQNAINEIIDIINEFPEDKFIFIIGGGTIAREFQNNFQNLSSYAKDWLGIAASRINADLVRNTISEKISGVHNEILLNPTMSLLDDSRIFFSGGWKPGWSTDYVAMLFAKTLNQDRFFKISDFDYILDVKSSEIDKSKIDSYSPLPKLSWDKIIEIVGTEWSAGINVPLDTKAAQFGKQLHNFKVFVGKKEQLINMIKGKDFIGSIIG